MDRPSFLECAVTSSGSNDIVNVDAVEGSDIVHARRAVTLDPDKECVICVIRVIGIVLRPS
jgi:hypothetical protein